MVRDELAGDEVVVVVVVAVVVGVIFLNSAKISLHGLVVLCLAVKQLSMIWANTKNSTKTFTRYIASQCSSINTWNPAS